MKPKAEKKVLLEFLKVIDHPGKAERKFTNLARFALTLSVLLIFYCLSDGAQEMENMYLVALIPFVAGVAFGLSIWFLQAGTQTRVLISHVSRESVSKRISELES